ncbi:hypothetical protein SY2F82_74260 [Streptomyces sp. Y2F8-2]|nr:hypothetical protein SY2F82_74260 [Streptomyces sp. Y2F8-2]
MGTRRLFEVLTVHQRQLGDVVAVAAGQRHRERDALPVDEDVASGVPFLIADPRMIQARGGCSAAADLCRRGTAAEPCPSARAAREGPDALVKAIATQGVTTRCIRRRRREPVRRRISGR